MGHLYSFSAVRRPAPVSPRPTFFSRRELSQLLSLYSRRVMSGEWRDYAIDQQGDMAVFSVFRRSQDRPLFAIAKHSRGPERSSEYIVFSGPARVKRAGSIAEALSVFEPTLTVVS